MQPPVNNAGGFFMEIKCTIFHFSARQSYLSLSISDLKGTDPQKEVIYYFSSSEGSNTEVQWGQRTAAISILVRQ